MVIYWSGLLLAGLQGVTNHVVILQFIKLLSGLSTHVVIYYLSGLLRRKIFNTNWTHWVVKKLICVSGMKSKTLEIRAGNV